MPAKPVNDIEKDSNVVLTKTPEEVNVKRDKAKGTEKKTTGFIAFCRKFDPIAMTCFVAIILAGVVVLGSYVNATYINPQWDSPVAVDGSSVKVEYVGSYGAYYDKDGAVIFDTNIKKVNNSDDFIKSLSYTDKTKFELLEFTVGGDDVLKGFGDAVIGKLINWTATVVIQPQDGYGTATKVDLSDDREFVINKGGTMDLEAFNDYASTDLTASKLEESPQVVMMPIGINAVVNYADGGRVTYEYVEIPAIDSDPVETEIDSNVKFVVIEESPSTFTVKYTLEEGVRMFKAVNSIDVEGNPISAEQIIYINDFDSAGKFKWKVCEDDSHAEQLGEKLYFYIKIVDIDGYAGA